MNSRIYYTKPSITEREVAYATEAARTGWGERHSEYVARFTEMFRQFTGARYAIATSSCTGALHIGLAAVGLGQGDEVILADTNWIATAAPVVYLGARPVFVDILPDTWCIDPGGVEKAITRRTKAIIATHLYGNLCDMDSLLAIAEEHGLALIEDAAEAIGSRWGGRHAGTMGRFGVFSFHGSKTLTTGEGGMLVTEDEALYKISLALSEHGRVPGQTKQFWPDYIGFKYKMPNVQAAIGCGQMERVEELVRRKREIFCYYAKRLTERPGITMNSEKPGTVNGFWMPTAVFAATTGATREKMLEVFRAENIDGRVFFYPLTSLPMFSPQRANANSYDIASRAINLPSYHEITESDQDRVVRAVLQTIRC